MQNQEIAKEFGTRYTDVTAMSRDAKGDPSLFSSDGLHYSSLEYAKWAAELVPVFLEVLQEE